MACEILNHPNVYLLDNNGYLNPDGWNDGADALSNIRDVCNGGSAKRSTYVSYLNSREVSGDLTRDITVLSPDFPVKIKSDFRS